MKAVASFLMITHNHPFGNLETSRSDEAITQQVKQTGNILDIKYRIT
jgi:DNA repair protein RadC